MLKHTTITVSAMALLHCDSGGGGKSCCNLHRQGVSAQRVRDAVLCCLVCVCVSERHKSPGTHMRERSERRGRKGPERSPRAKREQRKANRH